MKVVVGWGSTCAWLKSRNERKKKHRWETSGAMNKGKGVNPCETGEEGPHNFQGTKERSH